MWRIVVIKNGCLVITEFLCKGIKVWESDCAVWRMALTAALLVSCEIKLVASKVKRTNSK